MQVTACMCKFVHLTYIGSLSDEPLLRVEDVFDASDQLQRTSVIRALKDEENMSLLAPDERSSSRTQASPI